MLIKSLDATNFRKYHKLVVKDIPESGIIIVIGSNESGKTSIGEAICFALYGRTFFLDEKNLNKIVCWGSDVAETTLTFITGQGDTYELWRSIDRTGESHVKLHNTASSVDIIDDQTILSDDESVSEALLKLLGFDYDAFVNSFYLVQRELTSPDPQSHTIKQMAGIAAYAQITDAFKISNKQNEEAIDELTPQIETIQTELDDIKLDESWLPELIDAEETLENEQRARETLVGHLNDNEQLYADNYSSFHSARKSHGFLGILNKFLFPIAVVLWLLWAANKHFKEPLNSLLNKFLNESNISMFSTIAEKWLMPATIVAVIGALLTVIFRKKATATMQNLNQEAQDFASSLDDSRGYVTTLIETLLPERIVQMLHKRDIEPSALQILPPREQFNNLAQLIDDSPEYKADSEELTAAVVRLTEALKKQGGEIADFNKSTLEAISKEKIRTDLAGNLRSSLQELNKVVNKCHYNIETQDIAIGLMQRAAKSSIELFNKNITDLSATTLPSFTEERYSKMRIAEDFSVQIYSDEKKNYMGFDETSSGTQRQVMLALRMAMSEELSINTGNDQQFIFLDEPFAFFDQLRTKATLKALPDVSKVINQIWISTQEFPENIEVAKVIKCPLDETKLFV